MLVNRKREKEQNLCRDLCRTAFAGEGECLAARTRLCYDRRRKEGAAMQRILLAEDDAALGQGIRLALQSPAIEITVCRTLAQARAAATENRPDLLILDVNLPDGSGLELLEQVRRTSDVPVILLTANDLETDVVTGLESGADDYITKPFSLAIQR